MPSSCEGMPYILSANVYLISEGATLSLGVCSLPCIRGMPSIEITRRARTKSPPPVSKVDLSELGLRLDHRELHPLTEGTELFLRRCRELAVPEESAALKKLLSRKLCRRGIQPRLISE